MSRYARQIILPEIGEEGQEKLGKSKILIVGAGGLGSPAAIYLAAAGIAHLAIADADEVRLNNLNRQILYNESDLGHLKVDQAKIHLEKLNSDIFVDPLGRIDDSNISNLLKENKYDLVIDGTDNFETRYTVNNACVEHGVPFIHGSVLGWEGHVSVFASKRGPCYQCVYPEAPPPEASPTCVQAGVIGVVPGLVGILQASEAIKYLLDIEDILVGKMLIVNLKALDFKTVELSKDPKCQSCGR